MRRIFEAFFSVQLYYFYIEAHHIWSFGKSNRRGSWNETRQCFQKPRITFTLQVSFHRGTLFWPYSPHHTAFTSLSYVQLFILALSCFHLILLLYHYKKMSCSSWKKIASPPFFAWSTTFLFSFLGPFFEQVSWGCRCGSSFYITLILSRNIL